MGLGLVGGMPFFFGLAPSLEQPAKMYRRVSPCLEAARGCQNSADLGQPGSRREYRVSVFGFRAVTRRTLAGTRSERRPSTA
jgi:hypothetical protein